MKQFLRAILSGLLLLSPTVMVKAMNSDPDSDQSKQCSFQMTGQLIIYFVVTNGKRTGKIYSYKVSPGEDATTGRNKVKRTYSSEWTDKESLEYGYVSLDPGESLLIYRSWSFGEFRVASYKYKTEREAMDFILKIKKYKSSKFKEIKRIYNSISKPIEDKPVLDNEETIAIYSYLFGEDFTKQMGKISQKDKDTAQNLMASLLDASCKMGYAKSLAEVGLNPSSTAVRVVGKLMAHHLTKNCGTELKNARISQTVLNELRRRWKSPSKLRIDNNEW